jgi:hypothetical protein
MKMNFYYLLLLLAFICFTTGLKAQTKLSGEVTDKDGNPVSGVKVDLGSGFIQTVSDHNGRFSFVYPDTLKNRIVRLEAFNYKRKKVSVNKGQTQLRVILLDSLYSLQTVVVSRPKYGRFSDYSAQTVKMSSFDIQTNPAALADIFANMRALPGVQTNDNDGRLIIQGGTPGESQVYINDLLVANPYGLSAANSGVRSRFSSNLFDGVVLQSGGYNAEFGQALSGIVNLNTKERSAMESRTDISVSSVFAGISQCDQKSSYAYMAALSYTNLEPYGKLIPNRLEWNKYTQQWGGDFFLTKEFTSKTKMIVQAKFSRTALNYRFYTVDTVPFTNDLKQDYLYAQINLYHAFDSQWSLSFGSNGVVDRFSGTEVQYKNDQVENRNVWNHNKFVLQFRKGKIINRSGFEFIYNPFKETYTLDRDYEMKVKNHEMSVFNDTKLYLSNKLTANIGLRGEYSVYLSRFNLAPRFYLAYALKPEHILSASVGEYFQLPDMDYLKWENSLDFTSVNKATLSYGYVKQNSKFQLDTYYKKYNKSITYTQGEFQPLAIGNNGNGVAWGADAFWKSQFKSLEYWLTYSYNHTEKKYGRFSERVSPSYVAPHSLNAVMKYMLMPLKSLLGVSYNLTSGTPYYNESSPYEALGTTPFRNRLDMSLSYLPRPGIVIHFSIQNILGYNNIYGYQYSKIHPGLRQAITNTDKRFFFLGVFVTLSKDKKLNQIKEL